MNIICDYSKSKLSLLQTDILIHPEHSYERIYEIYGYRFFIRLHDTA